jgi:hypothetical protein
LIRPPRQELRIFPAIAVVGLPAILALLPQRFAVAPRELQVAGAAALAVTMLAAGISPNSEKLARVERWTAAIVLPIVFVVQIDLLATLVASMVNETSGINGLALLTTSVAIWATNILIFALAYWHIDRGGPWGRANDWNGRADFSFPRGDPSENFPEDWKPIFADYLDLAFNTSTAFSPTDVFPLTARGKVLMMVQSLVSLVTVITVGARAINILGK